ncbi:MULTISPECIES: flagellar biosynthesis protein FliQ [Gynuella]|uniref:Flagellar biosynthetic protein FliQ n=1 Tax=Gynuella sunshinyii YC6258 TaxID=1445510 RepID=A0A0C5VSK8_9GAMM|nr:flagellar biosynthesis protein FliQ [Gynuella sunshinyii]AJQ96313.1 flagellar biosynthesis pathway, component FliQ [Gynuella sunshinyii YC6258]
MDVNYIGDLFQEAFWIVLIVVLVLITPSLLVGLVVSTFQAATQINEQTLSFLPRLIVTILMIIFAGAWVVDKVVSYFNGILTDLPFIIG